MLDYLPFVVKFQFPNDWFKICQFSEYLKKTKRDFVSLLKKVIFMCLPYQIVLHHSNEGTSMSNQSKVYA